MSKSSSLTAAIKRFRPFACRTAALGVDLPLEHGSTLPAASLQVQYSRFGDPSLPAVLLCPSMSNNTSPVDVEDGGADDAAGAGGGGGPGWWRRVVGEGPEYGIDLNLFQVLVPCPVGSPFGSTSPRTRRVLGDAASPRWAADFPQITPADMADGHAALLDHLGIDRVHAVVGGSMGGMQSLQFALRHPARAGRCVAIAATGQTSPSTVALRSVQRAVVRLDKGYMGGAYDQDDPTAGPLEGMGAARRFGTICYRSREEFDARFDWSVGGGVRAASGGGASEASGGGASGARASEEGASGARASEEGASGASGGAVDVERIDSAAREEPLEPSVPLDFEVERYLDHQAHKFVAQVRYDANCYLLLSKAMDLMNITHGFDSLDQALTRWPARSGRDIMMLPFSTWVRKGAFSEG